MVPSKPNNFPNGSKKVAQCDNNVASPAVTFAKIQIMNPAGAATITALPKTKMVLSNKDLTITFPICGLLYGGNSNVKEEGTPFNTVLDNNLLIANVSMTPNIMTPVNISVESKEPVNPVAMLPTKNMDIMEIIVGKRPLQGTKLLVSIAIIRSLGESMILQPTTPAALQPNHIHMVSACFPQVLAFLK